MTTEIVDLTRGVYRRIYSGFRTGRRISSVSMQAEAWFWRLHCVVDDFGNHPADPLLCRTSAAPLRQELTDADIAGWQAELADKCLIAFYDAGGERYLHIVGFVALQPKGRNGRRFRRYAPYQYEADESGRIQAGPEESGGAANLPPPHPPPLVQVQVHSRSDSDTDVQVHSGTGTNSDSAIEAHRDKLNRPEPTEKKTGTGTGPDSRTGRYRNRADGRTWAQFVMLELVEAFSFSSDQFRRQRRSLQAAIKKAWSCPARDDVAARMIDLAADKRGAVELDSPVAAWQAEVNRFLPRSK